MGWCAAAVFAVVAPTAIWLASMNGELQRDVAGTLAIFASLATFEVVGALIVWRRPGNAVGWIFAVVPAVISLGVLAEHYALYALVTRPGSLPYATAAAWFTNWYWYPSIVALIIFTPLLFPDGRLPSRRWRVAAWVAGLSALLMTVLAALDPSLGGEEYSVRNPIGVEAVGDVEETAVGNVLGAIALLLLMAAVASLVVRFRRSGGQQREQLKWFTYATCIVVASTFAGELVPGLDSGNVVFGFIMTLLPGSVGVAILRYRLYDIDVIINRTLVYGVLTGMLAMLYFGGVAAMQWLLRPLGGQQNELAIVISTLAIAALFQPLRRRVQGFIDRRFYRRRYDAARTLSDFSAHLRDEVDLERLTGELLTVVDRTMQPAHVSLWLRERERHR